jgi:DNA-binding MarR family transcriptional regulator
MKSPPAGPSSEIVRAWTRLNRAQRFLFERIEAELKAAGLPPLLVYDALLELWRAPDKRLRQVDLEQAMLFPQYSISRLVDRLEKDRLVKRERCEDDARAYWVTITDKGLKLRDAMWQVYGAALARRLSDKLGKAEASSLADTLEKLYR